MESLDPDKQDNKKHLENIKILIDTLNNEKQEIEKIKYLILIENEAINLKDNPFLFDKLLRMLEEFLYDTDTINKNMLKGQILITITTILIITECKDKEPGIFLNFVNSILIEHIKNVNNYSNVYLRDICCKCLEELENEYPGLLFTLLGKKSLEMLENKDNYGHENKSSYTVFTSVLKKDFPDLNLESYGLYHLIEQEQYYVFQSYLSLYTMIIRNMISYYLNVNRLIVCQSLNSSQFSDYTIAARKDTHPPKS